MARQRQALPFAVNRLRMMLVTTISKMRSDAIVPSPM
jgi:hypothetical protein